MISEDDMQTVKYMSKELQLALIKGEKEFSDEEVQFFLPVVLFFTDFDWLEIIAENTLIEEDEKIVLNFLHKVQTMLKVNEAQLSKAVENKIKRFMGDL